MVKGSWLEIVKNREKAKLTTIQKHFKREAARERYRQRKEQRRKHRKRPDVSHDTVTSIFKGK